MQNVDIVYESVIILVVFFSTFVAVKILFSMIAAHGKNPEVNLLPYILGVLAFVAVSAFFIFKYYDLIPSKADLYILPIRFVFGIVAIILGGVKKANKQVQS